MTVLNKVLTFGILLISHPVTSDEWSERCNSERKLLLTMGVVDMCAIADQVHWKGGANLELKAAGLPDGRLSLVDMSDSNKSGERSISSARFQLSDGGIIVVKVRTNPSHDMSTYFNFQRNADDLYKGLDSRQRIELKDMILTYGITPAGLSYEASKMRPSNIECDTDTVLADLAKLTVFRAKHVAEEHTEYLRFQTQSFRGVIFDNVVKGQRIWEARYQASDKWIIVGYRPSQGGKPGIELLLGG